jgi:hypothetical protein
MAIGGVTMPKYNNRFKSPAFAQYTILDEDGAVVGTIRLKPSSVLWKGSSGKKFYRVRLQKFIDWVTDPDTKANKTKS